MKRGVRGPRNWRSAQVCLKCLASKWMEVSRVRIWREQGVGGKVAMGLNVSCTLWATDALDPNSSETTKPGRHGGICSVETYTVFSGSLLKTVSISVYLSVLGRVPVGAPEPWSPALFYLTFWPQPLLWGPPTRPSGEAIRYSSYSYDMILARSVSL